MVPVRILAAALMIQLLDIVPGPAVKHGLSVWSPCLCVGDPDGVPAPSFGSYSHLGGEPVDGKYLSLNFLFK